jgi:hypothetical protein
LPFARLEFLSCAKVSSVRQINTGRAASGGLRRLGGGFWALADEPEGTGDLADGVRQIPLSCSSEAELEFIADSFGVEVQSRAGALVAQKMFGSLRFVASVKIAPTEPIRRISEM